MDSNKLPKGHIIGWAPPPAAAAPKAGAALSKSAKKNAKRKEKREEKKTSDVADKIKDSWEDDDEEDVAPTQEKKEKEAGDVTKGSEETTKGADSLAYKMEKLDVR